MKHLRALNKYFWKYRVRLILGILFVITSNYFGILAPQLTGYVVDRVQLQLAQVKGLTDDSATEKTFYDPLVKWFTDIFENAGLSFSRLILVCGILLLASALLRGFFMFLMRQTLIVMSRHIEFDQKNEVYRHYQELDTEFYKTHSTGDLMSRMSEDVSRVRMYVGPAIMYLSNLITLIALSLFYMLKKDVELSLYVLSPLPVLAFAIYFVNNMINRKSEKIQSQLSDLTTNAQESYSGIRVIKSFVQENAMLGFFTRNSEDYRQSAVNLARVEAIYFPSIGLLIGLSTLITVFIGGVYQLDHKVSSGTIAEFVVYINMLTFPVSAIGWVASMIQRASASQKRLNEFLDTVPAIRNRKDPQKLTEIREIEFRDVDFIYPHTGIHALSKFNLRISNSEKIAVVGRTGSGKTTIAQLLLRMYDPTRGQILINGIDIRETDIGNLRSLISYVPQDVFLFSDSVSNNISFSDFNTPNTAIMEAARYAVVEKEVEGFSSGYQTMIGERGVTLSGGQKQRLSIARAISKKADVLLFDDCLSAVDSRTEKMILHHLHDFLTEKTAIIITHRVFSLSEFDRIIVLEDGMIVEEGNHQQLIALNGYYSDLFLQNQEVDNPAKNGTGAD